MKIVSYIISFTLVIGISANLLAQENSFKKHEIDIVKVYERVVADGYKDAFVYQKLATEYYVRKDFANAKKYFEKLFEINKAKDLESKNKYQQCLKALEIQKETVNLKTTKA